MVWAVFRYGNSPRKIKRYVDNYEIEKADFNIEMQKIEDQRIDSYVEREARRLVRHIKTNQLMAEALRKQDFNEYQRLSLIDEHGVYIPFPHVSAYFVYHQETAKYKGVNIRYHIRKRADEILEELK